MKLKADWFVMDSTDYNHRKEMETDVFDADEAFHLLRTIANMEPHKGPDWVMWIATINGYLYDDDGNWIASIPTMTGSWYRFKGAGRSMQNAANWPGN